jgi:hypothetical protein
MVIRSRRIAGVFDARGYPSTHRFSRIPADYPIVTSIRALRRYAVTTRAIARTSCLEAPAPAARLRVIE